MSVWRLNNSLGVKCYTLFIYLHNRRRYVCLFVCLFVCCWCSAETWHWDSCWPREYWGIRSIRCFQHGGEFCCQSTCHQLFIFVMMTLFGRIQIDYSDHYSAPKRIRIEYSVHPYKEVKCVFACWVIIGLPAWSKVSLGDGWNRHGDHCVQQSPAAGATEQRCQDRGLTDILTYCPASCQLLRGWAKKSEPQMLYT